MSDMKSATYSKVRKGLIGGASGIAISALMLAPWSAPTQAQPGGNMDMWWISLEGHYNMYEGDGVQPFYGNPGYGYNYGSVKAKEGFSGRVEVGLAPANLPYKFALRAEYGESDKENIVSSYAGYNVPGNRHEEEHLIIDFEAQRDVGLGVLGVPVTARAGIRFAHFEAKSSTPYGYASSQERKFTGAGPMIGANTLIPLSSGGGGDVSVDWRSSFALLIGERKNSGNFNYINGNPRKKTTVVPNVESSLALRFDIPNSMFSFSAGYRVNAFFNMIDVGPPNARFDENGDRILHGPFLRLTIGGG